MEILFVDIVILSILVEASERNETIAQPALLDVGVTVNNRKAGLINDWLERHGVPVWTQPPIAGKYVLTNFKQKMQELGALERDSRNLVPTPYASTLLGIFTDNWRTWPQSVEFDDIKAS